MVLPTPQGTGWMRTLGEPTLHVGVNLPEGETDLRRPAEEAVAAAMKRAFVIDPGREQSARPCRPAHAEQAHLAGVRLGDRRAAVAGACGYEQVEEMNDRSASGHGDGR